MRQQKQRLLARIIAAFSPRQVLMAFPLLWPDLGLNGTIGCHPARDILCEPQ